MKRIILLLCLITLSVNIYGQTYPIQVLSLVQTNEGFEVKGTSESMPGNETERHLIALYDALKTYLLLSGSDSIIIKDNYGEFNDNHLHSKRTCICYIDYSITQVLVDELHQEHIVLKITPGSHELFYTEESNSILVDNDIIEMTTVEECTFSLFKYPFIVKRKMENKNGKQLITETYNIGTFNRVFYK